VVVTVLFAASIFHDSKKVTNSQGDNFRGQVSNGEACELADHLRRRSLQKKGKGTEAQGRLGEFENYEGVRA
jgi:hypothetical protein